MLFIDVKYLVLKIIFLFFSLSMLANDATVNELLKKAEVARKSFKDFEAIQYYKQVLNLDSNNFQALWNISFVYQRSGWLEQDKGKKQSLIEKAISYSQKLIEKFPDTYEANVVYAGALARMTEFLPSKEKVNTARSIKEFGETAMRINPNDHQVWYLLGWLNFSMGKASWLERSLAGLLFGGLPKGMTIETGIEYLEKANELNRDCIVYLYDLATFYERTNTATAIQVTKKALSILPKAPEDFIYLEKCKNLHSRLMN